jgi:hypothetical protein
VPANQSGGELRSEENRLGSEPAFPVPIASAVDGPIYNSIQQSGGENGGLTKRELFAAMAMQGFASQPDELLEGDEASEDQKWELAGVIQDAVEGWFEGKEP